MNISSLMSIKYDSKYLSTYNNMVDSIFIMKNDYYNLQIKIEELKKERFLDFLFLLFVPLLNIIYFFIIKAKIDKKYSIFQTLSTKIKTFIKITITIYIMIAIATLLFTFFIKSILKGENNFLIFLTFFISIFIFSLSTVIISFQKVKLWKKWRNKDVIHLNLYIEFFYWYYILILRRFFNASYELNETVFQVNKLTYIFNFRNQEMKFNYLDDLLEEIWKYQPQDFYLSNDIKLLEIEEDQTKKIFDFQSLVVFTKSIDKNIEHYHLYFQIRDFL